MLEKPTYSAQDALEMIEAGLPPLQFTTGRAVYRAAVKRIAKTSIPGMITCDLSAIPMTLSFVNMLFERLEQTCTTSKKKRGAQGQWKSRVRTVVRRLEGVPVVQTTTSWDNFLDRVRDLAVTKEFGEQELVPLTSTLRRVAVEDGIEPNQMTREWLSATIKRSGPTRRSSIKKAAQLLDHLLTELPEHDRPVGFFGPMEIASRTRKGRPLPPRVTEELEAYISRRVAGKTAQGFNRSVKIGAGIKKEESTAIYRQATGWFYDCLCEVGELEPNADIGMADLIRLDWLGKVAFEALADENTDEGDALVFPWRPIVARTINNRVSSLIKMFISLDPAFLTQRSELQDPTAHTCEMIDAKDLKKILSHHCNWEMTGAHRAFCRLVVSNSDKQRLLLNMHMICWADAQERWKTYNNQSHHDKMQTMNLCILSAILALVVNIPFRARTVTSMVLEGAHPDLSLPKGSKRIEFHIAPEQMKMRKAFDAFLEDTTHSRSRQIVNWFIAGPRQELLRDPNLLPTNNRSPDALFCGVGRARYNRILSDWSEEIGLRMTTHLFRHALASILVNCCNCPLEEVARLLGNTVVTTERQYVFQDLIRRREDTLRKLESYRAELVDTHHPGRRRKTS